MAPRTSIYEENQVRINVFIPKDLHEKLKDEASKMGLNVSALIRMIMLEREAQKK